MANINTWRKRRAGVNGYGKKRRYPLDTSALRKESGKKPYKSAKQSTQ